MWVGEVKQDNNPGAQRSTLHIVRTKIVVECWLLKEKDNNGDGKQKIHEKGL